LPSLASPDSDRWLPIFWAIDQFKSSQAQDVKEGNWTMAPVDEKAVPAPDKARQAFIEAMESWDEAAVDVAHGGVGARRFGARRRSNFSRATACATSGRSATKRFTSRTVFARSK
jgi:hypothetical protein